MVFRTSQKLFLASKITYSFLIRGLILAFCICLALSPAGKRHRGSTSSEGETSGHQHSPKKKVRFAGEQPATSEVSCACNKK